MSKYKFRKAEKAQIEELETEINSTELDDASKTRDFKIEQPTEKKEEVFNPFEDEEEKPSIFNFRSFMKHGDKKDEKKVEEALDEIYSADVMNVNEIKDNLTEDKKIDLVKVFGEKKSQKISIEEDFDGDKDTYDIEEETALIEEDIYDTSDDEEGEFLPPVKPQKEKKQKVVFEYTDESQKEEVTEKYRKKGQVISIAFIATLVLTILLVYLETKAFPHPVWLMPGKFGILYLLLDLQLVFLCGLCVIGYLYDGAVALFKWTPNKNSVSFIIFLISVLQIILHLSFNRFEASVSLYSSVFGFSAVLTLLTAYMDARREHISFRVAASSKPKHYSIELDETSMEYEKFSEYLPKDLGMYKIGKTNFIKNFFKTTSSPSPYNEMYKISIPLVFLSSLVFAILSTVTVKGSTMTDAVNNFSLIFMLAMPIFSIFTVSLPFFMTTLRLARRESAIIGENSIMQYASTSLVSFSDTDVFHEKGIKVTSIKTYGKSRIDTTFVTAARVFKLVGGPLKDVFNRSVIDTTSDTNEDTLVSVVANGLEAVIDGKEVYVGNKFYMDEKGFGHFDDSIDTAFETSNGRIMYIATEGEISAKFYIKYALGRNFKALLDSFYSIGICIAVNSRDPNLDTKFVTQILKDENYPIVIVKREDLPTNAETEPVEEGASGIVSSSSIPNMLRTFLSADKLSRLISMNTIIKYISLVFAITITVILFINGHSHEKVSPLFILLYQFIWSLPVIGSSTFQ